MVENLAIPPTDPSGIDVQQVRRDTPTCAGQSFLDNAGSALPTAGVLDTVIAHLHLEAEVGGYVAAELAADQIAAAATSAAALVGTTGEHVALQNSATDGWNRALSSIPLEPGDRILTTRSEYASNVLPMLQAMTRRGVDVEFLPNGPDGTADPSALPALIDERVKVLAITHAPSQNGLVVDAVAFGAALRSSGSEAWYLLDACQSVGQLPINMTEIGCDFLSTTGRKFLRAPRGTGFLAVSDRALFSLEPTPTDMHGSTWDGQFGYRIAADAKRFQYFETSYANVLGLGVAADYALTIGLEAIRARIDWLAQQARANLRATPGVRVLDAGTQRSGIVVFACHGNDSTTLVRGLRDMGVTVTAVRAATNPDVFAAYESEVVLRASVHIYNTEQDLAALVEGLTKLGATG
ncbi:MAG: aminotransferase class V-fold PLP-dependent enzyme [Candidatus Nanopelagicales bacterium]